MNADSRDPMNPECEPFVEDLSHLVLGELADERRPALERHLVACAACRAERDLLARSVELVQRDAGAKAPVLELSTARRDELLSQAAGTTATPARARPFWSAPRLAAAAAVLIVGSAAESGSGISTGTPRVPSSAPIRAAASCLWLGTWECALRPMNRAGTRSSLPKRPRAPFRRRANRLLKQRSISTNRRLRASRAAPTRI